MLKRVGFTIFTSMTPGKANLVVMGIAMEGIQDVLSLKVYPTESANVWMEMLIDLKSRGVQDILFLCSDKATPTFMVNLYSGWTTWWVPSWRNWKRQVIREATVHHSIEGRFAICQEEWKLILWPGSGGLSPAMTAGGLKELLRYQS